MHNDLFHEYTYLIIILVFFSVVQSYPAEAQQPLPRESGFSGYIEILGAYTSTNSQLNTDSQNEKTGSLDRSGDRVGKFRPFPLGLLSYTFADIRTQLYIGILPENLDRKSVV